MLKGIDFMDNKFGMFIHWGIYSIYGDHEQILARRDLDYTEYESKMHEFDPAGYDPEEWVMLAKNAGAKYICFTAKHHDGFCMWNTKYTDYNIMNTPYKKDVLKMLSEACKKHGMLLSIYYSLPDWHHEYGYNPLSSHQWKAKNKQAPDTVRYREYVKNQIGELLTGYGELYTLFWDIEPGYKDESINEYVRSLQPGILINDRGFGPGDFETHERSIPDGTKFSRMTEACESVGEESWGYRKDEDYHSLRYIMYGMDKVMAMGGSYLLNVGPMPDGKIHPKAAEIFKRVGSWYTKLGGSLENTFRDTYPYEYPANIKFIALKKNGKTYLHFYNGITSGAVILFSFPAEPASIRLMNTGEQLSFEIAYLPVFIGTDGHVRGPYLRIYGIPVDELCCEPPVIEIEYRG